MSRDLISEIYAIKNRTYKKFGAINQYITKIDLIEDSFYHLKKEVNPQVEFRKELFRYVPIGMIAALESFFRMLIDEVLTKDNYYVKNVIKLKDINIKMKDIVNAQLNKLSINNLISHTVTINSLESIDNLMSTILDINFLKDLGNFTYISTEERKKFVFSKYRDKTYADINQCFLLRHIFAHEFAFKYKLKINRLEQMITSAKVFGFLTHEFISDILVKRKAER